MRFFVQQRFRCAKERRLLRVAGASDAAFFQTKAVPARVLFLRKTQPGTKPMKIQQIMTTDVEVVRPDASLHEAAEKMRKLDVGVLPVCDGDRLVGMITDRDITIRATAEGWNADKTFVHEVMTPEIVYCFEDDNTQEAENIMQRKQIRRLPVL